MSKKDKIKNKRRRRGRKGRRRRRGWGRNDQFYLIIQIAKEVAKEVARETVEEVIERYMKQKPKDEDDDDDIISDKLVKVVKTLDDLEARRFVRTLVFRRLASK